MKDVSVRNDPCQKMLTFALRGIAMIKEFCFHF